MSYTINYLPRVAKKHLKSYRKKKFMHVLLEEFNQGEIFKIVRKPWKLETDFKKVVLKAIEHYNLQSERDEVRQHN